MSMFYNIRAQFVNDEPGLLALARQHKPKWALVMDGLGLAVKIRQASPVTNVIHRTWPDGMIDVGTPAEWLARKIIELKGTNGIWAYTVNEVGMQYDWHIELIKLCAAAGWPINLVIGNISVGTPADPHEWKTDKALALLNLLDQYREHVVLGLHEYAHGVITSGLQDKQYETNPTMWPARIDPTKNNWHVGRFKWLVDACVGFGIKPPRIVITEFGFDKLGDMKDIIPGGGWRTLEEYWKTLWGKNKEDAYADQTIYARDVIYDYGNCVEAILVFQYGAKESGLWNAFDVENAGTYHTRLAAHEALRLPQPPEDFMKSVVIAAASVAVPVRFRSAPDLTVNNVVGYIRDPITVLEYANEPVIHTGGYSLQKFRIGTLDGWCALELLTITEPTSGTTMPVNIIDFRDLKARMVVIKKSVDDLVVQTSEVEDLISKMGGS